MMILVGQALTACTFSITDRYETTGLWADKENVYIRFQKVKELYTSSLINVHGTGTELSSKSVLMTVPALALSAELEVDYRNAKVDKDVTILFMSSNLEIAYAEGSYFVNNRKTKLVSSCRKNHEIELPLIVFGSRFIHCDHIFDWKNETDYGTSSVVLKEISHLNPDERVFFSAPANKLGLAQVDLVNKSKVTVLEFNENFRLEKSQALLIDCENCRLELTSQNTSFFGYNAFLIMSFSRPNSGFPDFRYCTATRCVKNIERSEGVYNTYYALTGDSPSIFTLKMENSDSPLRRLLKSKF